MIEGLKKTFQNINTDIRSMDRRDVIITLAVQACIFLLPLAQSYPHITNLLYIGILDGVIAFHIHREFKKSNDLN